MGENTFSCISLVMNEVPFVTCVTGQCLHQSQGLWKGLPLGPVQDPGLLPESVSAGTLVPPSCPHAMEFTGPGRVMVSDLSEQTQELQKHKPEHGWFLPGRKQTPPPPTTPRLLADVPSGNPSLSRAPGHTGRGGGVGSAQPAPWHSPCSAHIPPAQRLGGAPTPSGPPSFTWGLSS